MQIDTLIYIILSGIIALAIAVFQYYKKKSMSRLDMLFSFLRFISLFSIFLLIINPSFDQIQLLSQKPHLIVAIDNTSSIPHLKQDKNTLQFIKTLKGSTQLSNKFDVEYYAFGEDIEALDDRSLTFSAKQTNINSALSQLHQIYKETNAPTVLISDGNQTYGSDYQFAFNHYKQSIYPIILGDTITYTDLKIQQLNVNKYAYLKNKFPVETILVYNGNETVNSKLEVKRGKRVVFQKSIRFSKTDNSKVVSFTLPANTIGVIDYNVTLKPIESEKNTINNSRNFAIEVINQKTKIAIVSDFSHPDIGALKKSIESNEQRTVFILRPEIINKKIKDFQLLILYQPNKSFNSLLQNIEAENKNYLTVIGPKTDLSFLNQVSKNYTLEVTNQTENYQAELNINYTPFIIEDIDFESFPPLASNYGTIRFKVPHESILNKTLHGISVQEPLLATYDNNEKRGAVLLGENIWQWRSQSFINTKSFVGFDDFIGKIIQYLASDKKRNRLTLDYKSFYDGSENVIISAEFLDKNFVFDTRETLTLTLKNKTTETTKTLPFVLKNNNYQIDLSSLTPAEYSFTVKASNENILRSGSFKILEYNVEQQFLNANVSKLEQLALNTSGKSYFIGKTEQFIDDLLSDNRYKTIQKSSINSIPLIHWKYLLAIIALSLGLEWFLRKYNGLI